MFTKTTLMSYHATLLSPTHHQASHLHHCFHSSFSHHSVFWVFLRHKHKYNAKCMLTVPHLLSYPGYFREPHWKLMGLPEMSRVIWQPCSPWFIMFCGSLIPFYSTHILHGYFTITGAIIPLHTGTIIVHVHVLIQDQWSNTKEYKSQGILIWPK